MILRMNRRSPASGCLLALAAAMAPMSLANAAKPDEHRIGTLPTPIHVIQGSALASPLAGSTVLTEGIVTARTRDGFFLQSQAGTEDGDPATSQGLFVFTGTTPTGQAAVGNHLRATGQVQESIPAGSPHQMPVTRLANATLEVLSSGNALPGHAVALLSELAPDSDADALERYEGMRFAFPSEVIVVGPVEGTYNELTGQTTTTGVYHVVHYEYPRPFREPGLPLLDAIEPPAGKTIPRNDGNPERVRVDSAGQPGAFLATYFSAGNQLGNLAGVLHYRDGAYTLLPDPDANISISSSSLAEGVPRAAERQFSLGWMKMRRLFDDINDPSRAEPVMTTGGYDARIAKIAAELCDTYGLPDILAVGDVENIGVLADIAAAVQAYPSCTDAPVYQPLLVEANSADGLDLGFLVAVRGATANRPAIASLGAQQVATAATFSAPDGTVLPLFAQPPLLLRLLVTAQAGQQEALSVLATQFAPAEGSSSSAAGSLGWATLGDRVRATRAAQAGFLGQWLEDRQLANPTEMMAVVGGFESHEFSDGYVDVMGVLTGSAAPAPAVWLAPSMAMTRPLANLTLQSPAQQRYTLITEGIAQAPDHVLVNAALQSRLSLLSRHPRASSVSAADGSSARPSLRDPLRVDVAPIAFTQTDPSLHLLYAPPILAPGNQAILRWAIGNQGSLAAPHVRMEMRTNLEPQLYHFAPPSLEWGCTKAAALGGSRVSCVRDSLPVDAFEDMQVVIEADTLPDGFQADFDIGTSGGYVDADTSNDRLVFSTRFLGSVDLALRPMTPQPEAYPGESLRFTVFPEETTGNNAGQITIVSTIDARVDEVQAQPTYGFACDPGVDVGARQSRWTCRIGSGNVSQWVSFVVSTAVTDGGRDLGFHASISGETADRNPANNEVSLIQPISRAGDIAVRPRDLSFLVNRLDGQAMIEFVVETPTAGVSTNPRLELVLDVAPADIREVSLPRGPGPAAVNWACATPVPHAGGKSRIACSADGPLRHVQMPAASWTVRVFFQPVFVPGQDFVTIGASATVSTDSDDRDLANNSASNTAVVDQTTDQAVSASPYDAPLHEPNDAEFLFGITNEGTNLPRSAHITFTVDADIEPGLIRVTDSLRTVNPSCVPHPAPAGHTSVRCAAGTSLGYHYALVPTRPEWFGRQLTMTASTGNQLVDTDPSNNTGQVTVRVGAVADLCLSFQDDRCGLRSDFRLAIAAGGSARLPIVVVNHGVSTAAGTRAIVDAQLPAGRIAGEYDGQPCATAVAIGGGVSRVTCTLGNLPGDRRDRTVWLLVDGTELTAGGQVAVQARVESDRDDPDAGNNQIIAQVPVYPAVDLRLAIQAKGDRQYYSPQQFFIAAGVAGASAPGSFVEVTYEAEHLAAAPAIASSRWSCGQVEFNDRGGKYYCSPSGALATDETTSIALTFRPSFLQIGRPLTVRARHIFNDVATTADPTPANAKSQAHLDIGGRSTNSKKTLSPTAPTPLRRAPAGQGKASAATDAGRAAARR